MPYAKYAEHLGSPDCPAGYDVKREAGDIAGAFLAYSQCLYIDRKLAEADVGSTQAQDDLSVTLDRIGQMKLSVGDRAGALSAYEQSLTVRRTQAAVDPGNAVAQRALMIVLQRIGDLKLRDSDPDACLLYTSAPRLEPSAAPAPTAYAPKSAGAPSQRERRTNAT